MSSESRQLSRQRRREQKRINTIKERKGPGWFKQNASKAGKAASTHFDSDRGRVAANKRWHPEMFDQ